MNPVNLVAELRGVSVEYKDGRNATCALDNVSVTFPSQTSTALVGRSGSGKSTLISVLALMRSPSSGQVIFDGRAVTDLSEGARAALRARAVGIVFQNFHLEPSMSASENVRLPWYFERRSSMSRKLSRQRAAELLDSLSIGELRDRRPNQMSGGQRQRVAIARALFMRPSIFIADEPTGNLDEDTANQVADTIFALPTVHETTVVVVTHDTAVAARADRTMMLSHGRVTA
ncbi:MAG: transporter ATP-binding protein [Frankiales bacterium]|nr:transporter ATP-binding protein [Frankiales bacterium]